MEIIRKEKKEIIVNEKKKEIIMNEKKKKLWRKEINNYEGNNN